MSSSTTTTKSPCPILAETELWATIKSTAFKMKINFSIDNFNFYLEDDPEELISLKSPEFSIPGHDEVTFYLDLYPNGAKREYSGHMCLFLNCFSSNFPSPVYTKYKLSIVDSKGNDQHSRDLSYNFTETTSYGLYKMVKHSALLDPENGLLPCDQLTVRCEATICLKRNDKSSTISRIVEADWANHEKQFSEEMGSLLANGQHSDVILSVGGIIFPTHKAILSARSPIFAAMFSHSDTKEAQEGKVDIDDVSEDVFKDFLKFIYTNEVPEKERLTTELLAAADKYQVNGLKSACENHLSASLSIQTAASTLFFADMHSAHTLKANAIKFIASNIFKVMPTEAWKQMAKDRPELMDEICEISKEEEVKNESDD